MAIQDLINEVNSIQTKKQSIKEAITAKGVTSEGKLSKFADEIKQISTGEPDWFILNRIRHDNGNEGVYVRTNTDGVEAHTGGAFYIRPQGTGLSYDENTKLGIINGSYFKKRETLYRRVMFSSNRSNATFTDTNNTVSFEYFNTYTNGSWKSPVFNDVNKNGWLKPYKNDVLVNHNALYFKAEDNSVRNDGRLYSVKDITGQNAIGMPIYATLGRSGTTELSAIVIDSSTFLMASKWTDNVATGFFKCDNRLENIYLKPMKISHETDPSDENVLYLKTDIYSQLPIGNYAVFYFNNSMYLYFIGINYVVNGDGLKEKNIEVYPYKIFTTNSNYDLNSSDFTNDKPVEFYLNFSEQGQKAIKDATSIKSFRRQVLVANGTPEARASNFLTGNDALLGVMASKLTDYFNMPYQTITNNSFKRKNNNFLTVARYMNKNSINGNYISNVLADGAISGTKITGFIRLNEDSNAMFPIELEEATQNVISDKSIKVYNSGGKIAAIFPNGVAVNNKMVVLISSYTNHTNVRCFYVKKGGAYITNDWFSTERKMHYLYLTLDAETQKYLTTKPLPDIWTEINSLNRDDFEAYSEE